MTGRVGPAPRQPLAAQHQRRVVGLDVTRVEGRHDHAPLALPDFAVHAEQARLETHLQANRLQPFGAAETFGPVAQHADHGFMVGHHQHPPITHADPEVAPVLLGPAAEQPMHLRRLDLRQVAQHRPALRAGHVLQTACRGRGNGGVGHGVGAKLRGSA